MNEEEQYVVELFKKSFGNCEDELLALYGLGHQTEIILNMFPKHHIIGLLDGFQTHGNLYGSNIISLKDAEELGVCKIVVVARTNSAKIIARRIKDFCQEKNIEVFDLHGRDLLEQSGYREKNNPYFKLDIDHVKQLILSNEAISFDIFDTLLMRKVFEPMDVFTLLEREVKIENLAIWRIQAERELNCRGVPSLEDIYKHMASLHPELDIFDLQQRELRIEKRVLCVRRDIVSLLNFAVQSKKIVSLISDMYLSASQINCILDELGIKGYQNLFVSSMYGTTKLDKLFDIYKSEVPATSYLHIGDDIDGDIEAAKRHGINTLQILKARDMLDISSYCWLADLPKNLSERCILGLVLSKIFNNPFSLYGSDGRPILVKGNEIGYLMMGPLLTSFVCWLLYRAIEHVDCLLLAARDGYLIEKICNIASKYVSNKRLPAIQYFLTSRMAAIAASIVTEQDLYYAARIPFAGTLQELMKVRFFLLSKEIEEPLEGENVEDYVSRHKDKIFVRSAELRKMYRNYVNALGLDPKARLGFFDLVSSGTCHMCTEIILDKSILGFYLIFIEEEYSKKKQLQVESFIERGILYRLKSYLSTNYEPIEGAIVPNKGTFKSFDETGEPEYLDDHRSAEELRYVCEIQEGILEFCSDYYHLTQSIVPEIRGDFADLLYSLLRDKYTKVIDSTFSRFRFKDDFCNREFILEDMFE